MSSQVPLFSVSTPSQYPVIGIVGSDGTIANLSSYVQLPWRIEISPFQQPKASVGTWSITVDTASVFNGFILGGNAQNDSIDFDVTLAVGTWTCSLIYSQSTNRGIATIQLDDGAGVFSTVGTLDLYGAATANVRAAFTGVTITETVHRTLRIKMATKNASSSAYLCPINQIVWRRTA